MSFHVKKLGNSYKLNFSSNNARVININRLPNKTNLQTLDIIYKAQPFCDVVSKNQETKNLDIIYKAQPYVGTK